MTQNRRDFTTKEWQRIMKYLFLKGNSAKEIYDDVSVTLDDKHISYSIFKNWFGKFRAGHLSTEDEEYSGRSTQLTTPENVDAIHSMILRD
jgi:transposase